MNLARPPVWEGTSAEEQADDAAALLDTLGLAPAAVFGTSSGGIFALAMSIRHPESVRAAILHEPALLALFDDPAQAREQVTELIKEGMLAGGSPEAFERFLRFVAGDANWESLDANMQERVLASADSYFEHEVGRFDAYVPDDEALGAISAPVELLVSDGSLPEFAQAAGRIGQRLGIETTRTPGTHFPYLDHPKELAATINRLPVTHSMVMRRSLVATLLVGLIALCVLAVGAYAWDSSRSDRIAEGVKVGELDVGGLSVEEAGRA